MSSKKITDQDIKYLAEKAEYYRELRDFKQALEYYDVLAAHVAPHPFFFKRRAFCHRMLRNMDAAIKNYDEALKLDPDDAVTYWERGACFNDKPFLEEQMDDSQKRALLERALADYNAAIERMPVSQEAWLAIIDIDLCLLQFDDAISVYGACKPYITSREYQVIRSWYGCLALTLAGDPVEEEDERLLNDLSIRLSWNHWALYSIDVLLKELAEKKIDPERLQAAASIHQKFLDHFDGEPLSFSKRTT